MDQSEIYEYISALTDRNISGLSQEEIKNVEDLLDQYPGYFGEFQIEMATKICLLKHNQQLKCPEETQIQIQRGILRILKTLQSVR